MESLRSPQLPAVSGGRWGGQHELPCWRRAVRTVSMEDLRLPLAAGTGEEPVLKRELQCLRHAEGCCAAARVPVT